MIKKLLQVITLACLLLISSVTHSQVTIGKAEKPSAGALLDLKNLDTPGLNGETANKGLMLPRVELSDVSKLYPMLPSGYDIGENAKHNGLVVFNMGTGDVDLCIGIYVWDSQKWNRIPEPCNQSLWSTTNLLFYKSALVAKSITLDLSRDNAKVTWAHDSTIPWLAGGFPQNDTRKITKTFTFQPQPNVAGADLTSNVTATVSSDGKVSTETITITQLNREMTFATPATVLPAVGAEHSLNVDSEADWTASVSSTNPGSMITAIAENTQLAGNSRIMKVTIDNNNTWAERIAKLDITSTNPDFLQRTVDVKQGFATPYLNVTDPTAAVDVSTPYTVRFSTNAKWRYDAAAGSYDAVTAGASGYGISTVHNGGAPVSPADMAIVFQPSGNNDYQAGDYETTIRFSTQDHGSLAGQMKDITLKRTVPIRFDLPTVNPAWGARYLYQQGDQIKALAYSNWGWYAKSSVSAVADMDTQPVGAGSYAHRSVDVAVHANNSWNNRLIDLHMAYHGGSWGLIGQYWQKGWTLNYNGWNNFPNPIPRGGLTDGHYHFGVVPEEYSTTPDFRVRALYNSDWSATESGAAGAGNRSVGVVAWNWWGNRTVHFQFAREGWEWVGAFDIVQLGYNLEFNQGNLVDRLPANGGWDYFTDTWGDAPNFRTLVSDGIDGNSQPAGSMWADSNYEYGAGRRYFNLPAKTSVGDRTLYLWVEKTNYKWELVSARTQAGQPWTDAGGWWIHNQTISTQIVALHNETPYKSPGKANSLCSNTYGAEWQAIWHASSKDNVNTGSTGENWDFGTEAYSAGIAASAPFSNWTYGTHFVYYQVSGKKRMTRGEIHGNPSIEMPKKNGEVDWGATMALTINLACAKRK